MPEVSKTIYKGKTIIIVDYRGCIDEDDMIRLFRKAVDVINRHKEGVRVLINFEGAFQTPNYLTEAKLLTKQTQDNVIKRAIVGLNLPPKLILLDRMNQQLGDKPVRPFRNMDEAMEWLVT